MLAKPKIIIAANRFNQEIVLGIRHFDKFMKDSIWEYKLDWVKPSEWEQGFIDQFGKFYTREEAMNLVKENGQPFDAARNGHPTDKLFSEGLY